MSQDDTAPESTLPYPPVHNDKKFVVLTDWYAFVVHFRSRCHLSLDYPSIIGTARSRHMTRTIVSSSMCFASLKLLIRPTIVADMTDFLGYGKEKRREGNLEILSGRVTFRYGSGSCVMIRAERSAVCTNSRVRSGICRAETPFGRCWRALTRMDTSTRSANRR
jgi:hypothetical protein